jgi:hypothetical protein
VTATLLLRTVIAVGTPDSPGSGPASRALADDRYHPVWNGEPVSAGKALVDTILILGGPGTTLGKFQDLTGTLPQEQGWIGFDQTHKTVSNWNVSTFNAANLDLTVVPNHAMWCGQTFAAGCGGGDPAEGYDNYYNEWLDWTGTVANNTLPTSVTVNAMLNNESERDYDMLSLEYESAVSGAMALVPGSTYSGLNVGVSFSKTFTVSTADYVGVGHDQVHLRWVATADYGLSDGDCLWPTSGHSQIDKLEVLFDGVRQAYDDFEGAKTRTGPVWAVAFPPNVGDFSKVWPLLDDIDPCHGNSTPQFAFIDDGIVVPGTGGSFGMTWTYGPSSYIHNLNGGLLGPDFHLNNEIWSPELAWPQGNYDGALLTFDVYRHLPIANGLYYVWHVRSSGDGGVTWSPWRDRNYFYYSDTPQYVRVSEPISDLVLPGCTHIQIALGVNEIGWAFGFVGTDGTPAPYFDNVALRAFACGGPSISARDIDLFQDNFPASGQIEYENLGNNSVRLDMARNISPLANMFNDAGDSAVVDVKPIRAGSVLNGLPELRFRMKANPLFDSYRTLSPYFTQVGSLVEGVVYADSARVRPSGAAIADRWSFDLPDSGFFFPGDELHFYFRAQDNLLGNISTTVLPSDTTGFSLFSGNVAYVPVQYPSAFKVRALPTLRSDTPGDQPAILFWNDSGTPEGELAWCGALWSLGYVEGQDYDIYSTKGASSGVGNGLGGRTNHLKMSGYNTLLYGCGDLGATTLSNGDWAVDPGNDIHVVDSWLRMGGKNLFCTGDDLVSDLSRSGVAAIFFREQWLSVAHVADDVRPRISNQTASVVRPILGNTVLVGDYVAYGDCPLINDFDAVNVISPAQRIAEYTSPSGGEGAYPYAAAVYNNVSEHMAKIVYFPYDLQFVEPAGAPDTGRLSVLRQIMLFFGHAPSGWSDDIWAKLQAPSAASAIVGVATSPIYGRVMIQDVTSSPGAAPGLVAQLGYGPDGESPLTSPAAWRWVAASFNADVDADEDEFVGTLTIPTVWPSGYTIPPPIPPQYDFCYRYSYYGGPWAYGDLDGSANGYATVQAGALTVQGVGLANLQGPEICSVALGFATPSIYGRALVLGVPPQPGVTPGLMAELGYGPDGSDPTTNPAAWQWAAASFSADVGDIDEFGGTLNVPALGQYDYCYRFSYGGEPWVYGDLDGVSNGYATSQAGALRVQTIGFTEVAAGLRRVSRSAVAWGDCDNDGDLDILLTGADVSGSPISLVCRNNDNGTFTEIATLAGVVSGSVAWGDYDNDEDLDILLAGSGVAKIYRNNGGGVFAEISAGLQGVSDGSAAWGDYDNDGDLDILLAGSGVAKVYRNDGGGVFVEIAAGLPGVSGSSVAWGDFDNDGDLDLLLAGDPGSGPIARVYRNNGNGTFTDAAVGLPGVSLPVAAWGDFDSDGDLDILLAGSGYPNACVYRNNGNGTFTDAVAGLPGGTLDFAAWGDYDNDGDPDILLATYPNASVYRNNSVGAFTDATVVLPAGFSSSAAWGDYDNDGDLDVLLTGTANGEDSGAVSRLYRSDGAPANTPPSAPAGLASAVVGDHVTLSWTAASDGQTTAAGLSYNVRIGTTPGGNELLPAMASADGGYRRVVDLGNAQQRTSWTVTLPPIEETFYWSAQAVDASFAGGPFAAERSYVRARDTVRVEPVLIDQPGQFAVPITFTGLDSLGVISMYVNYDSAKLTYMGVRNQVPGEFFSAGLVGGRISIQWFDETGGMDPILPAEADTLCSLLFTSIGASEDSTQLHFEFAACQTGLGDRRGDPITAVWWRDQPPYGQVVIRFLAMVAGSVIYYSGSRPVADAVLSLGPPNPDVVTDASGYYNFLPYAVGDYTLHVAKQSDLGGINSLDALKVIRHSTGIELFGNPDKVFVANVNGDSYVNAFDAIKIVRAAVDLEQLPCGNWAFAPGLVNFTPLLADTIQNFKAFRMGDANGDWIGQLLLAAAGVESETKRAAADVVTISLPDTTISADRTSLSLPLHVRDFLGIGAVSLRIQFADSVLQYTNLTSQAGVTFTSNLVGSEIRIEWFDMTGGSQSLNIASGNLLTLDFAVVGTPPDSSQVRFTSLCTLADATGSPLSGVMFQSGRVGISSATGVTEPSDSANLFALHAGRPNPFNPRTTISYSLLTPGRVTLVIYDVRGARIANLVDADLPAGEHSAEWTGLGDGGTPMPSGVCFARLETAAGVRTVKVTLAK